MSDSSPRIKHTPPTAPQHSWLTQWLIDHLPSVNTSEDVVLVGTAIIVGLGVGLGNIAFRFLIDFVSEVSYEWIPEITSGLGKAYVVFVPAIGGLLVGLLVYFFAREAKGHGVPEVMQALALRGGRIRPIVALIKAVASALTIGSGGSAGREGPIIQIGSGLGSSIGQALHLSEDRIRNLVACGAAAGIAAAFNAPIAGVLFALEIILGEFRARYFSTVVISAVIASVISRATFGNTPAFPVPTEYGVNSLLEYAFYPVLAILAALVSVVYVRVLYKTEDIFDDWSSVPEWFKPAVGGALLGVVALAYPLVTNLTWDRVPQIFDVGYEVIVGALSNELLLGPVVILLGLKMIATSLTLGSGGSGGVFAPSLFMGAMLGTAFELVINQLFPEVAAPPGAYALLGMAAIFGATAYAPITAIMMLFELTNNHLIILPLMLTVVIATILARIMLKGDSIYTLKLSRRGIHLDHGNDVDVMQGVSVSEAMITPAPTIDENSGLEVLQQRFLEHHTRALCVINESNPSQLLGIVTLGDLQNYYENSNLGETVDLDQTTVGDICSREVATVSPNDVLWTAIRTMGAHGIGRLPVVMHGLGTLVGIIARDDIMRAYNLAIARKIENQHRAEQMRLNALTGGHVFEMRITAECLLHGKHIQDIKWPAECVVASIRRKEKLLIPHGYTKLHEGDVLAIVAAPEAEPDLAILFEN